MSAAEIQKEIAIAREAREKLDEAKAQAAAARELESLKLEAKLELEHGPRGSLFEIVETVEGPIGITLGTAILHKRFQAAVEKSGSVQDTDVHDYVFPCVVHPAKEIYLEIVGRRPAIGVRCANALSTLFGAKDKDDAGKY